MNNKIYSILLVGIVWIGCSLLAHAQAQQSTANQEKSPIELQKEQERNQTISQWNQERTLENQMAAQEETNREAQTQQFNENVGQTQNTINSLRGAQAASASNAGAPQRRVVPTNQKHD